MKSAKGVRNIVIAAVLLLLLAALLVFAANKAGAKTEQSEAELLRSAIIRASVTCYAIEGRYPQSLQYVIDHYGVVVDADRYIVSYDVFADNLMPDVRVLRKGAGA